MSLQNITTLSFLPLTIWLVLSLVLLFRKEKASHYWTSIPGGFTSAGVLGTFIGIVYGLWFFDVENIEASIPQLLTGLKYAFLTSIVGIILSLIFGKVIEFYAKSLDLGLEGGSGGMDLTSFLENQEAQQELLIQVQKENQDYFKKMLEASNATQQFLKEQLPKKITALEEIHQQNHQELIGQLKVNNEELSTQIAEMNTKGLLEAMEKSAESFNEKMQGLLERLVKENFSALNNSVKQLNDWQVQHKEDLSALFEKIKVQVQSYQEANNQMLEQSKIMNEHVKVASEQLENTAQQTEKLTASNGKLQSIVEELDKVLLGDKSFDKIVNTAQNTIQKLEQSTESFNQSSIHVKEVSKNIHRIQETMVVLTKELEELAQLKDTHGAFWEDIKAKLEEGVQTIDNSLSHIGDGLEGLDEHFQSNLHKTFETLDKLIKGYIVKHNDTLHA